MPATKPHKIRRLLVANRSEIAIRVMRASAELGIDNVAIYSEEDRFALHRFKADQNPTCIGRVRQGAGRGLSRTSPRCSESPWPVEARDGRVHPGYGFLSEKSRSWPRPAATQAKITFVGPAART